MKLAYINNSRSTSPHLVKLIFIYTFTIFRYVYLDCVIKVLKPIKYPNFFLLFAPHI